MKVSFKGRKEKGRRLELRVAKAIREKGLDKYASRMVLSGADWANKGDIRANIPLSIECKNNETHNIWKEFEQAKSQEKAFKPACLVISGNFRPILACIELDTLLNLLREIQDLKEEKSV